MAAPNLRTVLRLAGSYAVDYHERLTTVVADEVYVQRHTRKSDAVTEARTLLSEFAIVQAAPADEGWFAIRDILEVDGRPIEESPRIRELLNAPRERVRAAAFAIAVEQMKYNLGDVYRTINVPTLPLEFLLPHRQRRFRFRLVERGGPERADVAVAYDERERPTIIRTPKGRNVVSRGTVWIDPADGRVLKTELVTTEPRGLRATITVAYEHDARLGFLVPVSMQESYVAADSEIAATATYRNFRRFETGSRIVR